MDVSTWMATSTHIHYITWVLGGNHFSHPSHLVHLGHFDHPKHFMHFLIHIILPTGAFDFVVLPYLCSAAPFMSAARLLLLPLVRPQKYIESRPQKHVEGRPQKCIESRTLEI